MEAFNLPDHGEDRLLHRLLRLRIAQPASERCGVNQSPIRVEKLTPTLLRVGFLETTQ